MLAFWDVERPPHAGAGCAGGHGCFLHDGPPGSGTSKASSGASAPCKVADAFVKLAVAPFADRLVKSGRLNGSSGSCLAS